MPAPVSASPAPAEKLAARDATRRNWRTLRSFLRPYRWRLLAGSLLAMVATATGLATPLIVESVIEHLTAGSSVTGDVVLFGSLTLVYLLATLSQWALLSRAAEGVVFDVRAALVRRFLRGRVADVRERPTADLVARATADAPLLHVTVTLGFTSIITSVTGIVGSIVLMGVIDVVMLSITLGAVLVLATAMALIMPRAGRERAKAQEAVGAMSTELDGSMRALRTIKAARAESVHEGTVLEGAARARRHVVRAVWAEVMAYETGFAGMLFVAVFTVAFGSWRVTQGHLTVAALVAFVMYTQGFIRPLMQLADGFATIQSGLAASNRITEAQEIPFEDSAGARAGGVADAGRLACAGPLAEPAPLIELVDVAACYKPTEDDVVRGLSLRIPRRGHVAIVGPSGAGKSSVASLMLRFLTPRSGTILLDGVPYEQLTYAQVRERFAYVEQEPPVLPFTVRDNLAPANRSASDDDLREVLHAVGLDDGEFPRDLDAALVPATMTGSARQRLAVARALLAADADVLVIDDATSQIAGEAEQSIQRALRAFAEQGAVVTIGNRLSTVAGADHVVVMDRGRVRAAGMHQELLAADPLYASLVGAPVLV